MSYFSPLLFIFGTVGMYALLLKKRFEEVLPISFMLSSLVLFISGFIDLRIGYGCILIFASLFPIFVILISIGKIGCLEFSYKQIFTPGSLIFLIVYSIIYILNLNKGFITWDEVSHWGPMVKEMIRLNRFYSVKESVLLVHKDYPPIISIFEYLWCKLCGGYKECYLYRSLQTLSLSLFMPLLCNFKWKKSFLFVGKIIGIVLFIILGMLVVVPGEAAFYSSIYIDCILALLLAYGLVVIYRSETVTWFDVIQLSILSGFIVLTKQMGLVFFLFIVGTYYLYMGVKYYRTVVNIGLFPYIQRHYGKMICLGTLTIFVPMCFYILWNRYINWLGLGQQFDVAAVRVDTFFSVVRGISGEEYQRQAFHNFIEKLFLNTFNNWAIPLTFFQVITLLILLFYGITRLKRCTNTKRYLFIFVIVAGSIVYSVAMVLLYMYSFGPYEGPRTACFERYMNTYSLAIWAFILMIFIAQMTSDDIEKNSFEIILITTSILFMGNKTVPEQLKPALTYSSVTQVYDMDIQYIEEKTELEDSIYLVAQHSNSFVNFIMAYRTSPRTFSKNGYSLGEPYDENDVWTVNQSPNDLVQTISDYDYLYLQYIDDQFVERYSGIFHNEIMSGQLYRVKTISSNISLELVK